MITEHSTWAEAKATDPAIIRLVPSRRNYLAFSRVEEARNHPTTQTKRG